MSDWKAMGVWRIRANDDGWFEIYSLTDDNFVYAKCPTEGQAVVIKALLDGDIKINKG